MNVFTTVQYIKQNLFHPAILLFFFASLFILFCFLSNYHNLNQRVVNFIPFVLLLSLNLIIICNNQDIFQKLTLLLFLYCIVCIPLLLIWVSLYRKSDFDLARVQNFYFFVTPEIYLQYSLALIYPLVFGIYFSLFRYIRLGQTIDLSFIFLNDYFFFFLFTLPHLFLWFLIFLYVFKGIRTELWTYTAALFYALHLRLLKNRKYFVTFKQLHWAHFFISDIFFRSYSSTSFSPFKSNLLTNLHRKSYIFPCMLIVFIICEVLVSKGKVYYSVYLLFLYPIILFFVQCLSSEVFTFFVDDVCKSDYLAKNFASPRYYSKFYSSFNILKLFYVFNSALPKDIENTASTERIKYISKNKRRNSILRRTWGYKLEVIRAPSLKTVLVHAYAKKPWNIRFAASYYSLYGVRWFSSSRVLFSPNKLHSATGLLTKKNPYNILALVGHPGQNFNIIQRISKKINWPLAKDLYGDNLSPNIVVPENSKALFDVIETNFVVNYQTVASKNVIVGTYRPMMARFRSQTLFAMQKHPDTVLQFNASNYKYQNLIGIDHKFGGYVSEYGRNQILTVQSLQLYEDILLKYRERLIIKGYFTEELGVVLQELQNTAENFQAHQQVWAEYLPPRWSPPLYINPMFQEEYLRPEVKKFLQEAHAYNAHNSQILYERGVPELTDFSENGLSSFEKSFLQDLLGS